jgi:DNA-binding XRE family transcriptional regulator
MLIEGRIIRDGRWYLAEIPLLDGMTQSRTRKGALAMASDWVKALAPIGGVEVSARALSGDRFVLECDPPEALIALALRRRREAAGLSLADVARRIGAKSRNAYARYEQGTALPTITKLAELFRAVDPERDLTLTVV